MKPIILLLLIVLVGCDKPSSPEKVKLFICFDQKGKSYCGVKNNSEVIYYWEVNK